MPPPTALPRKRKRRKITNRKLHYWASLLVALPLLFILPTGLLLLLKKQIPWVQPPTAKGHPGAPTLTPPDLLARAQALPQMEVQSWQDINRLDWRPSKGVVKIRAKNQWEAQLDHQSGDLLALSYRRSDLIESLHDGSYFGEFAKYGLWLPATLALLVLWVTGLYLFALPWLRKKRNRSTSSRQ